MRSYPIPSSKWIEKHCSAEDISKILAFIDKLRGDKYYELLFDDYSVEADGDIYINTMDSVFSLILAYVDEKWEELDNPLLAVEDLVTDFRRSRAIWLGGGSLPPSVAGIGSIPRDDPAVFDGAKRAVRALVHNSLGSLVEAGLLANWSEGGRPHG